VAEEPRRDRDSWPGAGAARFGATTSIARCAQLGGLGIRVVALGVVTRSHGNDLEASPAALPELRRMAEALLGAS
jgi:hypothetical protein